MAADPTDAVQLAFRWSDAFAILGAAAWIPQLVRLMRGAKVTVVPGSPVEIGFTGFGPIFNPTLAFRTQHRDSLVVGIECDLVHQHGQKFVMTAAQLSESAGFTQSADQTIVHGRQQSAIAIVLSPTAIAERRAASHQVAHRKSLDQLMVSYGEAVVRVQPGPTEAWFQRVQATPEYGAARNFMREAFRWQAGSYKVTIKCKVAELRSIVTTEASFSLTPKDVELLRANLSGIDQELYHTFCDAAGIARQLIPWKWIYKPLDVPEAT